MPSGARFPCSARTPPIAPRSRPIRAARARASSTLRTGPERLGALAEQLIALRAERPLAPVRRARRRARSPPPPRLRAPARACGPEREAERVGGAREEVVALVVGRPLWPSASRTARARAGWPPTRRGSDRRCAPPASPAACRPRGRRARPPSRRARASLARPSTRLSSAEVAAHASGCCSRVDTSSAAWNTSAALLQQLAAFSRGVGFA